jgi:WXG100 family type VII secretion target
MTRPARAAAAVTGGPHANAHPDQQKGLTVMPDVRVTYAEMESAAKQLITGHQEITSKLSALKTMVDGLVQNGYVTDSSSKAFEASYSEFNKGVSQTIEGLEGMSKYLTAAAKAFGDTDSQLANALK